MYSLSSTRYPLRTEFDPDVIEDLPEGSIKVEEFIAGRKYETYEAAKKAAERYVNMTSTTLMKCDEFKMKYNMQWSEQDDTLRLFAIENGKRYIVVTYRISLVQ